MVTIPSTFCHCSHKGGDPQPEMHEDDERETLYLCPMHPEIRSVTPDHCSICGMALEAQKIDKRPLAEISRRLWIGIFLIVPLLFLDMAPHGKDAISSSTTAKLELFLATLIIILIGKPFLERGISSIKNRSPNMYTLISLGVSTAFIYSIIATLAPGIFPPSSIGENGYPPLYFEASSLIILLVTMGELLEMEGRERTKGALTALINLKPRKAHRIQDGREEEIAVETINVGDQLRVRPGEQIPVDGYLMEGEGYVDESMITGESTPLRKLPGSSLIGATINFDGVLTMKTTRTGRTMMLTKIIELMRKAQRSRAPIQRIIDQLSSYFVFIVLFIAALSLGSWILFAQVKGVSYGLLSAVSVLIIACPCALGLATPMSITVGIGRGAKNGILIRDGAILEMVHKVDTVIFDKTGTLTQGSPTLISIIPQQPFTEDEILRLAASVEAQSNHPLAQGIVQRAKEKGVNFLEVRSGKALAGKGVIGFIGDQRIAIGQRALMEELSIKGADLQGNDEKGLLFIAVNDQLAGRITVSDAIRESALPTIHELKSLGIKVVMLTGDDLSVAQRIAKDLSIETIYANVLPADKLRIIERYKAEKAIIAMVGDGINDAPALAAADVGIAIGSGSDIAIESSSVTLIGGDLRAVGGAIRLSKAVMRNIKQNLFFAFFYNVVSLPLAAGLLYPLLGITFSPVGAALAMSLSSLTVIANGLRLYRVPLYTKTSCAPKEPAN